MKGAKLFVEVLEVEIKAGRGRSGGPVWPRVPATPPAVAAIECFMAPLREHYCTRSERTDQLLIFYHRAESIS